MKVKDEPNRITATLKVVIAGEFYDDEATEETLRYAVEQDLEDVGFEVDDVSILKEQEARVLDWNELEDWGNAVWFEDKDEHECYIALIANVGTYDAKFVNVEPGMVHRLDFLHDFYKKEWRCWSARPTIKQRQAVKWG